MPPTTPADTLLQQDRWATGALLDACAALTDDQLDREFEMGLGTLRRTITHTLAAKRAWTDVLNEASIRDRLEEGPPRSVAELRDLAQTIDDEFDQAATAKPLESTVDAERGGRSFSFVRAHILTHVATHAFHHRAQCQNMLRRLGVEKLPQSSVIEWAIFGPGAR
jgi:uncharacterized damage-inducible protein DinB